MAKRISETEARKLFIKNNLEPLEPFKNSQVPWKSKCLITGKTVSPTYGKVRDYGHRCEYCSGYKIDEEDAIKLMISKGFKPLVKYPGGNPKWKSRCLKCERICYPSYTNTKLGVSCPFCAGRAVVPKEAKARMLERGFRTLSPFPGATKPWKVQCLNCKRIYTTVFHSMKETKTCKYCRGKAVVEAELIAKMKLLKLKPLEPYKTAKTPWKSKCLVCGHIVQPTWMRIKQGRGHCAYCARRRVDIPEALNFMKSLNLKPLVEFPGNNKPWKCECLKCHKIVTPRWSDLRQGQGGCSNCANYGINMEHPGYLYLLEHPYLKSLKVGIGNNGKGNKTDDRIYKHKKQGWKLLYKIEFEKTRDAASLETQVFKWIRSDIGLEVHLSPSDMPQGGWSETFKSEEIDAEIVWEKMVSLSRIV